MDIALRVRKKYGAPLPLLKLVKKMMVAALRRKFRESLPPPLLGQISGSATVHSPSLNQKVHRAPLYYIGGGPGFSKYNITITAEYCPVIN